MHNDQKRLGDQEIDLRQLLNTIRRGRLFIVAASALGTAVAIAYALLATEIYRSEAVVQPRGESHGLTGVRALTAQLGGLADVAGLSGGLGDDRDVAVATLRSRAIIEALIRDKNLLPELYPAKWDVEKARWRDEDPKDIPTPWEAYNDFKENIFSISEDARTGLTTVAIEWRDPEKAQQWVAEIISRTNAHLKARAINEGEGNLSYLETQSRKVQQVELQQAVYKLVEGELKKLMLAKGTEEFAVKVIDPPVVPQKRLRPRRKLIVIVGFLLSSIGATGLVLVWAGMRQGN